jgi:hypothetical protein
MAGRPRGAWSDKLWRDALRKAVLKRIEGGQKLDRIAEATVAAAMEGKMDAVREIGDRLDGKPAQSIDMAVTDERTVIRAPEPAQTAEEWRASLPKPH